MSKQWTIVSLCNKKRNVVQLSQELASSSSIRKWRLQLLPYAVYQLKRWKTIQLQNYKPWSHSTAVSTAIQGWIVVRFRWINVQILVMSASSKSTALCDFVCFLSDLHGVVWLNFRFSGSLNISQSFDRAFRPNKRKEFRQKIVPKVCAILVNRKRGGPFDFVALLCDSDDKAVPKRGWKECHWRR